MIIAGAARPASTPQTRNTPAGGVRRSSHVRVRAAFGSAGFRQSSSYGESTTSSPQFPRLNCPVCGFCDVYTTQDY
jgi:hypothetical protein